MAEGEFSVCHCSVSSAVGLGDASKNALLTEQWHTAAPIATIRGYTRRALRLVGAVDFRSAAARLWTDNPSGGVFDFRLPTTASGTVGGEYVLSP